MKELFVLNKYFIKYKWRFLLGIIFVVSSNLFFVLQPKVIREALDLVVENVSFHNLFDGFSAQGLFYGNLGKVLLLFGGLVLALAVIQGIFMYFMRQTIIVMSRLIEYDIRNEIFAHYEKLSLAFYKRNNTGDLMARITEDVNHVRMYLGPAIMYSINLVALTILVISSMISVSPTMTLYVLIPLPILSISIYYVSNLINKRSTEIQGQLSNLNSISQEVYSGIRVVKSYVQEKAMGKFFAHESDDYKEKSMGLAKIEAAFYPIMLLLIGSSVLITIYVGGLLISKGTITAGNIAEFVIYVNMLTWPVTAIGWVASIIQRAAASQKRINEFLQTEPDIQSEAKNIYSLAGAVAFDKVTFDYPDTGIRALENVSFKLEPGQRLAILGKTGSGKTTIADLLVRMYDVTEGAIKIDGKDITIHSLAAVRERVGYVTQDVFLFSDTISNNVRFGRPEASQAMVERYTKYASIYDEILELEHGFDTIVGERGVTLSGGQKQRVSIARALIKRPDILLLDDCLSAVDTNTEHKILDYLETELKDKTAIIITHRIYSSLAFDKIIVLEDGKIVEEGKHEDLLQNKGFYYELFEKQKLEETEIKA